MRSVKPSLMCSSDDLVADVLPQGFKYEPNYQETFWGENYEQLLKIKKKVDPSDVLWCHPCVGNEGWEEREDGRLCQK